MMAVAILVPPISTEQTYLFSMSLSLGDKKQLQEMKAALSPQLGKGFPGARGWGSSGRALT
jgi:hypothetical protein